MLRIIKIGNHLPDSYTVDSHDFFEPGMIASFTGWKDLMGHDICSRSRGPEPIGIIDDIRNGNDDSTKGSGRITIWNAPIEIETDQFEVDTYFVGQSLFTSGNGKFCGASFPQRGINVVASITKIPHPLNPLLHCKWLPQTVSSRSSWKPNSKEWDGWIIKEE